MSITAFSVNVLALGALVWAGIKLPQEMAEPAFMGLPFTPTRPSTPVVALFKLD